VAKGGNEWLSLGLLLAIGTALAVISTRDTYITAPFVMCLVSFFPTVFAFRRRAGRSRRARSVGRMLL